MTTRSNTTDSRLQTNGVQGEPGSSFHQILYETRHLFRRGKASWERMLVTQPPEDPVGVDIEHYSLSAARQTVKYKADDFSTKNFGTEYLHIDCDGGGDIKSGQIIDDANAELCAQTEDGMPLWGRARLDLDSFIMLYCDVLKRPARGLSFAFGL